jgi:hypothetical protein
VPACWSVDLRRSLKDQRKDGFASRCIQAQTSGSGGAELSIPVAAHPLARISSADNARGDLRRQKTSVQQRSSQTRAPSPQSCASGPPNNPHAMRRYRRRRQWRALRFRRANQSAPPGTTFSIGTMIANDVTRARFITSETKRSAINTNADAIDAVR